MRILSVFFYVKFPLNMRNKQTVKIIAAKHSVLDVAVFLNMPLVFACQES